MKDYCRGYSHQAIEEVAWLPFQKETKLHTTQFVKITISNHCDPKRYSRKGNLTSVT